MKQLMILRKTDTSIMGQRGVGEIVASFVLPEDTNLGNLHQEILTTRPRFMLRELSMDVTPSGEVMLKIGGDLLPTCLMASSVRSNSYEVILIEDGKEVARTGAW